MVFSLHQIGINAFDCLAEATLGKYFPKEKKPYRDILYLQEQPVMLSSIKMEKGELTHIFRKLKSFFPPLG